MSSKSVLDQSPEMKLDKIEIGGVVFAFRGAVQKLEWPNPFYTPFISQKKPDVILEIEKTSALPPRPRGPRLFEGSLEGFREWEIFSHPRGYQIEIFHSRTQKRDKTAVVAKDFSHARLFLRGKRYGANLVLRPLMEIILLHYLAPRQGLILHGASVRDGDKTYLFSGQSGNGKTTMSRLWYHTEGDISVLNDERSVLRKTKDGWKVYGTPWPGNGYKTGRDTASLGGVFMIRHGKKNEILPASPAVLFQELFTQVFSSFWDAATLKRIAETCEQAVLTAPCYRLAFLKDPSVTDFIRKVVKHDRNRYGS